MTTIAPLASIRPPARAAHPALAGCLDACRRLDAVAALLHDDARAELIALAGPHLRHALEHVTCLADGAARGRVDYSARLRDEALERSPLAFRRALARAVRSLSALGSRDPSSPLVVTDLVAPGCRESAGSTVARELAFVASHSIHHLATIALLLKAHGVELPRAVVLAFSTAEHEKGRDA